MNTLRFLLTASLLLVVLVLAGCTTPPDSKPVLIDEPVDAFNAVGRPYTPSDGSHQGSLSTDVEWLQDAHRLYENARVRQNNRSAVTADRSQERCLQQSDSRRVPIEGGAIGAVYCEPAPE